MAANAAFLEGNGAIVSVTFKADGVLTDPTTVTLKVKSPTGATTTYTYALGEITRTGVGAYKKTLPASILPEGRTVYRYLGTGTAEGSIEGTITINPSEID